MQEITFESQRQNSVRVGMLAFAATIAGLGVAELNASVLFQHTGAVDPATEGWTFDPPAGPGAGGITFGPIFNDPGHGTDAWYFHDQSSLDGSYAGYHANLNGAHASDASTLGWKFSTSLRVVDIPDQPDFALFLQVFNGGRGYSIVFGSQADGDPIVQFVTNFSENPPLGPAFALEGGGPGYHTYDWTYDPALNTTSIYVDGIERMTGYSGYSGNGDFIAWGSGGSLAQGHGNFSLVRFEVVPEPSSLGLLVLGALALARRRARS